MEHPRKQHTQEHAQPKYSAWSDVFTDYLQEHFHGVHLEALARPKPEVAAMAEHFGGNHMPLDALEVAKVAHIAELAHHLTLGPNIGRALTETFGETVNGIARRDWESDPGTMPLKYIFGLVRDFPVITNFIKAHEARCERLGQEYVDIEGLVNLVEHVNFESIIIKSALDYSNFLLLDEKEHLTDKEKAKMKRIITAIKTVDSPLLALTGLDALEAEILSKAYCWELEQSGDSSFVTIANETFEELGGRQELARTSEEFLEQLFARDTFLHDRVTSEQEDYGAFFTDGMVILAELEDEFRVLARLKSVGSTAKKMHSLYNKTETLETPMDIIGATLIVKDEDHVQECLSGIIKRLSELGVTYQAAPSRSEHIHVKGSDNFIARFGANSQNASTLYENLSVMDERCDNGYEAVKITIQYTRNGIEVPIEIQITHETARKESRVGLASHTLFKLMKLTKDAGTMSIGQLSTSDLIERLQRISIRKNKFDKSSYETNGDSTNRANHLYRAIWKDRFVRLTKKVGSVAIHK